MDAKQTLTPGVDKPGWYGCKNPQGKSVVMYWQGNGLYVGCDWSSPSTLSAFREFVGPLVWPGEHAALMAKAADDPEVIDRVLDRVSDALRELGVSDGEYPNKTHLEIVRGLREKLLHKPLVLPPPGTVFYVRLGDGVIELARYWNGTMRSVNGIVYTEKELNDKHATIEESHAND